MIFNATAGAILHSIPSKWSKVIIKCTTNGELFAFLNQEARANNGPEILGKNVERGTGSKLEEQALLERNEYSSSNISTKTQKSWIFGRIRNASKARCFEHYQDGGKISLPLDNITISYGK